MHRPNYAMDAPPTCITVGGISYPANTDYRVWIDVLEKIRDLYAEIQSPADLVHNRDVLCEVQCTVFGGVLEDEAYPDVLRAIMEFARGYPSFTGADSPATADDEDDDPVYSFDYDINEIVLAIRNQSGIDISYRRKEPFHWWEFLLEFRTLCGEHRISRMMEIRGYKGDDKSTRKAKRRLRLPYKPTADEQRKIDAFNAAFGEDTK